MKLQRHLQVMYLTLSPTVLTESWRNYTTLKSGEKEQRTEVSALKRGPSKASNSGTTNSEAIMGQVGMMAGYTIECGGACGKLGNAHCF